jgi:phage terminase large subunit GpA-like protein
MRQANEILSKVSKLFAPPPRLKVSEWADRFRKLSSEASAEPGQWRTSRAEYQRGMMDAVNDPTVETVVIMSSAQIGKSDALVNNTIGYFIHQDPSPILLIQPTVDMAESYSKDRIATMIRDTPELKQLVGDAKAKSSNNTVLHKKFVGGQLVIAGANSPAGLASRPIRVILADEVDRYPASASEEGDPVNLAVKRTTTFWNRKIILVSTPTIKGASRIEKAFNESDQRRYFVACPHCQHEQHFVWGQVKWGDSPQDAWYECESCGKTINNSHKIAMIRAGKWKATAEFKGTAGFAINELYSPWRTFGDVAVSFLKAKDDPELLKVWVNTSLGETFDDQNGEGVEWQQLAARAEPYTPLTVPSGGKFLTAGVDVQGDRLSVSIWAWGRGEESWLVYTIELYGDPLENGVWEELDAILLSTYTHSTGNELRITAAAIDTGFKPQEVYNFIRTRPGRKLFAVKGLSTPGKPILSKPTPQEVTYKGQNYLKGIKLWGVGTDTAKSLIYSRLRLKTPGAGYVHTYIGLDEEFYQQITAEKLVTRYVKGFPKQEWVKIRPRNEALDTLVYSYAAAIGCGMARLNWDKLELSNE